MGKSDSKLIEYAISGAAVVCSRHPVFERAGWVHGVNCLVAKSQEEMALHTLRAAPRPALAARAGRRRSGDDQERARQRDAPPRVARGDDAVSKEQKLVDRDRGAGGGLRRAARARRHRRPAGPPPVAPLLAPGLGRLPVHPLRPRRLDERVPAAPRRALRRLAGARGGRRGDIGMSGIDMGRIEGVIGFLTPLAQDADARGRVVNVFDDPVAIDRISKGYACGNCCAIFSSFRLGLPALPAADPRRRRAAGGLAGDRRLLRQPLQRQRGDEDDRRARGAVRDRGRQGDRPGAAVAARQGIPEARAEELDAALREHVPRTARTR